MISDIQPLWPGRGRRRERARYVLQLVPGVNLNQPHVGGSRAMQTYVSTRGLTSAGNIVANSNAVASVASTLSGTAAYGRPSSVLQGRMFRLGVQVKW